VIEKPTHAFAKHFKQDVEELIISPGAIRRVRMKHRETFVAEVQVTFKLLILHWDSKIMENSQVFQVLEESESTAYPLLSPENRCKTVICTKTP